MYRFDQSNAIHIGQQNMPGFSFQNMMNTPTATQNCETMNGSTKRVKRIQDPNAPCVAKLKNDWTSKEEIALTEAWLHISTNADVGTNQKNPAMWNRILQVWKEKIRHGHKKAINNNIIQCHWFQILGAVSKFVAKYEQLERYPKSGTSSEDLDWRTS
ncbi:unnamed protein product [Cuscuta europaea]|nr:unnamed protein product [Cuscuta europaea]